MNRLFGLVRSCLLASSAVLLGTAPLFAAPVSQAIKLDAFGYRPADAKIAIFTANPGAAVQIRDTSNAVRFTVPTDGGSITARGSDGVMSGDDVWWVDFTPFTELGTFRLYSATIGGQSYDFVIGDHVYDAAFRAALKTFYLQRCNTPKTAAYAGAFSDAAACHIGDASTGPAAGHTNHGLRDLRGGWHDAGDYNKYAWSAASGAILFLLRAYERNPAAFGDDLGIPESGNGIPDVLDEVKWELDWLLRMQLPNGLVLSQMHVVGFAADSPPSADTNVRYYQNPNVESGAVLAGSCALAARVYGAAGQTAYADTLRSAALAAWSWLLGQGGSPVKAWAAAELFRLDPTLVSARAYVDGFHGGQNPQWANVFFNAVAYDSQAALTYVESAGATPAVVANMRENVGDQVDYIFWSNDLYRNGMPDWSYYWGSNSIRAGYGVFLLEAARLGETGGHTGAECIAHAQEFLHFFHGQNPLRMVYLTNMAALGGEHSSFQFYHAWFGDSSNPASRDNFLGKPPGIVEPAYPYFAGTDNLGVNDNKSSLLGPPPGFVPGGPNKDYSGTAVPPGGETHPNRAYRDWADQADWTAMTWEITENSIGYQGPYVALVSAFAPAASAIFGDGFESGDTAAWSQAVP